MSEQELILRTLEKLGEAQATVARLTSELAEARAELAETKKPCGLCNRTIADAIGDDFCTACDADAQLHDVKAANDELGKQIARLTEQAAAAERVRVSGEKMCKGVWATHEAQFAAQSAELADLRKRCEAIETAIVEAYTKWRDADEVFHKANDSFDPEWTGQRLNAAIRESNQAKQELDTLLAVRREQKGDE